MRVRSLVVGLLAAGLVGLLAVQAWAFPEFARETRAACAACHVNPAGGVDLSDAGKAYKTDQKAPAASDAKGAVYLGVNKCKMCHFKQYKAWQETNHAHALENLRKADPKAAADMAAKLKVELKGNPADDEACVTCHVTAFHLAGGYPAADSTRTAGVSNMTCEGCHGPGSLHVPAPAADKKKFINGHPTANMCTQCHTPATSPNFKFDEYKAKGTHVVAAAKK